MSRLKWIGYSSNAMLMILGFLLAVVYTVMIILTFVHLNRYHANFQDYIFNLKFYYTPDMFYHSVSLLDKNLRYNYIYMMPVDFLVAILYASFGSRLSYKIITLATDKKIYLHLSYLFIYAAIFNIFEDISLGILFYVYPTKLITLCIISSMLTTSKLVCLAIGIGSILLFGFILLFQSTWVKHILFLIKSFLFSLIFPLLKKHYGIKVATTLEEKEKVFEFRYKIYREELQHYFLDNNGETNHKLFDQSDFDDNVVILYSGDIRNITGTIKFSIWKNFETPKVIMDKYDISKTIINEVCFIAEVRFFEIRKDFRKSLLGLCLIGALSETPTKNGIIFSDVILCDCQPGIVKAYQVIGGFPYTHKLIYKDFGILFIPLMITPFDFKYFKKIRNIFYFLAKRNFQKSIKTLDSVSINKMKRDYGVIIPRISLTYSFEEMAQFSEKMTSKNAAENSNLIFSLLKDFIVLTLEPGTVLIKSGIVDYDMFLLLEGTLDIKINDISVTTLEPGTLFGEMALLDKSRKRYVDVISGSTSKVLLVPRNLLFKLEKTNPRLAIKFLHILCSNLVNKLSDTNKLLMDLREK